jgi:hypothetical protein
MDFGAKTPRSDDRRRRRRARRARDTARTRERAVRIVVVVVDGACESNGATGRRDASTRRECLAAS